MTSIRRITRLETKAALLAFFFAITAAGTFAGTGGGGGSLSGIADREINRRLQRAHEAEDAIARGDKYYADGDYEQALNEYKTALDLLPEAPATQAVRDAATARYCDAAVGLARQRAKGGRYDDARSLLKDALARNPDHAAAKTLVKQLDDTDRYNPALTPQHVQNVEDVNRHLKLGVAFEELGDHDNAIKEFQDVLRIDRYNSAARQDMERVEQEKTRYYASARDHMRSRLLNDVNKGWEEQVPQKLEASELQNISNTANAGRYLMEKMQRIVFPTVQFQGASIDEAVEFLRIKSKDLDTMERDPTKRGVNIILRAGSAPSTAQITLELRDVPMVEALRYITELAGMKYKVEPFAVLVVPVSDVGTEQYTRTFKVPPDFLTGGAGEGGGAAPAAAAPPPDPFAAGGAAKTAGGGGSTLPTRGSAVEILKSNGITFPEGASATFIAATSQLIVRNTQPNLDAVESFVDSLLKKVPQMISISTKFVEVSQKNTDELGFDWLVGAFNVNNGIFAAGGTSGNSKPTVATKVTNGDYPFLLPGTTIPIGQNPVTVGNRSGSAAITPDSIDGQIQKTAGQGAQAGPGIFSLTGVFTDPQFQLVIRALSQKKGVDLMSAPSVTTRSGQRASVEVVREFIYPTEFNPPQIPTTVGSTNGTGFGGGTTAIPVTPTTPTAFTMRPVGVKMEVDPVLGPDGYTIDLNLAPEVTEFDGFINYGTPITNGTSVLTDNVINQPIFSVRKIQTAVTVWDGQTVVMGGLIREDVQDVQDKVPILGDLPLVGRLFQTKAQDHFKRNLMVFVTAKLIDPSGQAIRNTTGSSGTTTVPPTGGETGVSAIPGAPGLVPPLPPTK
jgi:general secretion pathway protein D